jgi:hypothetical protein
MRYTADKLPIFFLTIHAKGKFPQQQEQQQQQQSVNEKRNEKHNVLWLFL